MAGSELDLDKLTSNITVVKKMKNYRKDPAFRQMAADAKAFIKKYGLPGSFKKKK